MSVIAVILGYGVKFAGYICRLGSTKTVGEGNNRYITDEDGNLMTWKDINKRVVDEIQSAMDYHLFQSHYEYARMFATTNDKNEYGEEVVKHKEIHDLDAIACANEISIVPTTSLVGRDGELSYRRFELYHMRFRSLKGIQGKTRDQMALAGFFRNDGQNEGVVSCQHCRDEDVLLQSSFSRTMRRHAIDSPRCKITNKPWSVQRKELTRRSIDNDQFILHAITINRERIYLKKMNENQQRELQAWKSQESSDSSTVKIMQKIRQRKAIPKSNPIINNYKTLEEIQQMTQTVQETEGINSSVVNELCQKLNSVMDNMKSNRCVSCLVAEATVVQLPCFHKILCAECYRRRRRVRTSRKEHEDDCDMCKSPIAIASATYPMLETSP